MWCQVVGAVVAAAVLYAIASGAPGFDLAKGFAANGYGEHSPGKYSLFAGLLAEIVLTMMFLFIIMGATHGKAPAGFAPIAIGLGLTLIHLVGIPITNTSVNPGPQHRPGAVRRRLGPGATLDVLGCAVDWRRARRNPLPLAQRGALGPSHRECAWSAPRPTTK